MGIRRKDYYFECSRCNRQFHVRKRRYVSEFYCPICGYKTFPSNIIRKITKKQIEAIRTLRRSNQEIINKIKEKR